MKNSIVISILLLAFGLSGFAEGWIAKDSTEKEDPLPYKIKLKYADRLFEVGNYYEAMDVYLELTNERPDNKYLFYQLAEANRLARDYVTAERWYEKVIEAGAEEEFPMVYYHYAQMLKMNKKYEQAKYAFAKFILRADEDYTARARREIEACDFAKRAMENPDRFQVLHLDSAVNSPYSEYAPTVLNGELYYSSLNRDTSLGEEKYRSHLYKSKREEDTWTKGLLLPEPLNGAEFHSGNCSFSPDGKRMYFTKCTDEGAAHITCKIYLSIFTEGNWGEPIELSKGVNDPRSNNTHPSVAKGDGSLDILYFASNRSGGFGGYDIWYSEVNENGISSPPVNLGGRINTSDDEITPFYYNKWLYFSSRGHIGLGGFDVFLSAGKLTNWSKPKNIGYPANSSADDMYYTKGEEPRNYYLVSNRPGIIGFKSPTCCDDIFLVKDNYIPKFAVKGKVFEKVDSVLKGPVMDARVEIKDITGGENVSIYEDYLIGENEFFYNLAWERDYQIKVQKKGYFSEVFTVNTSSEVSDTFYHDVGLTKILKNKSYRLEKIYYEYDKDKLNEESKESLDLLYELLIENPKIVIEISSHTDSIGSEEYNLDLSQRRAQACVDYLIKKGIKPKRLIAKGYGESMPIAPNSNPDGSDNPKGRQLNRRTEIKVIGELSRKGDKIIYD